MIIINFLKKILEIANLKLELNKNSIRFIK